MNVELQKATVSDAPSLLQMQKTCFSDHLARYQDFDTSPATATVERVIYMIEKDYLHKIFCDNLCVGAINIRKLEAPGSYKLHMMYILPEHQGKGIGQAAIRQAESLFPDAQSWCLETLEDMPLNRHVYENMGYHFTGQTEKINDKLTIVFYEKSISDTK